MRVVRAQTYVGFCGGVKRAWNRAVKAAGASEGSVFLSGKLIHNTPAMQELEGLGVRPLEEADVAAGVAGKTILMRAHGEGPLAFERARSLGLNVVDATCPIVTAVQKIAVQLEGEGYQVIVFGHRDHPEAKATVAYTERGKIIESAAEARDLPRFEKLASIAQTTMLQADYLELVEVLRTKADHYEDRGRICGWTLHAQDEAVALAQRVQAMVVVGGRDSSNTIQLVRVCQPHCPTYHVLTAAELRPAWFEGLQEVGVVAGASTREVDIQAVIDALEAMGTAVPAVPAVPAAPDVPEASAAEPAPV
ncbi:MAG TPA: 4-hydroxy-3-methylbut-2-enyl diphosphate reductase [Chloroflexota bacterium]|nr:4-hydroxy-3-methylbut-2-enyl diphosphate reductase [Chloroflexota bacterium]